MKGLENARGERSIEGFKIGNKVHIQRVKKRKIFCPTCRSELLITSETNSEMKCNVCKTRYAIVLNSQYFMITSDRREHE